MTIDEILSEVIRREGGYVNHPADRGGPTKFGITLKTLRAWRSIPTLGPADVESLELTEALRIYRYMYFEQPGIDGLPEYLWPFVVDAAVHHGAAGAIRMLQRALKLKDDGIIGPATLTGARVGDGRRMAALFVAQRARAFAEIVKRDQSQAVFVAGWLNRLAEQIESLS